MEKWIFNRIGQAGALLCGDGIYDRNGHFCLWVDGRNLYNQNGYHVGWTEGGVFTIATMMLLVLRLIIHSISLQTLEMVAIQAFLV